MNTLFELKDIAPQLEPKQIKTIEHIIYFAKERKEMQLITGLLREIIVFPSGKIMFKDFVDEAKKLELRIEQEKRLSK